MYFRWVGGKQKQVVHLLKMLPPDWKGKVYEPFAGAAALSFHPSITCGGLMDTCYPLINTHRMMRDKPYELIKLVNDWFMTHSHEQYYNIRSKTFTPTLLQAAQFLYLRATCFNGLYRTSRLTGCSNVPMGDKQPKLYDYAAFAELIVPKLQATEFITCVDYSDILNEPLTPYSLVYFDPPYYGTDAVNGCVVLSELRDVMYELHKRGHLVMMSNSMEERVRLTFAVDWLHHHTLPVNRTMSGKNAGRGNMEESLFTSWRND